MIIKNSRPARAGPAGVRVVKRSEADLDEKVGEFFKLSEHFCKCGECDKQFIHQDLYSTLDFVRKNIGKPFIITSGYRCPRHNINVGGASKSKHMDGIAVDVSIKGASNHDYLDASRCAIQVGFKGIKIYKSWIHLDLREKPGRW